MRLFVIIKKKRISANQTIILISKIFFRFGIYVRGVILNKKKLNIIVIKNIYLQKYYNIKYCGNRVTVVLNL